MTAPRQQLDMTRFRQLVASLQEAEVARAIGATDSFDLQARLQVKLGRGWGWADPAEIQAIEKSRWTAIELAVEAARIDGQRGVLIEEHADSFHVGLSDKVPYGQIHRVRLP